MPIDAKYDVVVVGGGVAGLTSGALLAKAGKKTLVLEQHHKPGGYAQSFSRHGFHFDSSVHFTGGCVPMDNERKAIIHKTLDLLGVADLCAFKRLDPFVRIIAPGFVFDVPSGLDAFTEALISISPGEEKQIRRLVRLCVTIDSQIRRMPENADLFSLLAMPFLFPQACIHGNRKLCDVLDETFKSQSLKTVLGLIGFCFATPYSYISFALWTHLVVSFIDERACYCMGTFQNFANALMTGMKNHRGTIALKRAVKRIVVHENRIAGVVLDNDDFIETGTVISNADLLKTYTDLIGPHKRSEKLLRKLRDMRPSMSAMGVYIETDFDMKTLPLAHENVLLSSPDLGRWSRDLEGDDPGSLILSIPTLSDPVLAPEGRHCMMLLKFMPYRKDMDSGQKQDYCGKMVDTIIKRFPDLQAHILYRETASPLTFERYTSNRQGAALGWEYSPGQVGYARPSQVSPIRGLFHAGHWTRPGGGMYGAVVSGRQAARLAAGYPDQESFIRDLQKA